MNKHEVNLGEPPDEFAKRDAVHVAVMPAVAETTLYPGDHVKLAYGTTDHVLRCEEGDGVGIVDPFLTTYPRQGERVWVFLYPNTVTGIRHDWSHASIDSPAVPASEAEAWLRRFADRWCFDYDEMVEEASSPGGCIVAEGRDLHSPEELGEDHDLFWRNLESVTGKMFCPRHRGNTGWSCSC